MRLMNDGGVEWRPRVWGCESPVMSLDRWWRATGTSFYKILSGKPVGAHHCHRTLVQDRRQVGGQSTHKHGRECIDRPQQVLRAHGGECTSVGCTRCYAFRGTPFGHSRSTPRSISGLIHGCRTCEASSLRADLAARARLKGSGWSGWYRTGISSSPRPGRPSMPCAATEGGPVAVRSGAAGKRQFVAVLAGMGRLWEIGAAVQT